MPLQIVPIETSVIEGKSVRHLLSASPRLSLCASEIDASVERDRPVSSRRRDSAKSRGIDVHVRITPDRPVQDIDCVGAKCEQFIFADPHFLAQSHIQAQSRWPSDTGHIYCGVSRGSRLRVL